MSNVSYLLVDGHSVMHAWPQLKRNMRTASGRRVAQAELLACLRTYQDVSGRQVVVVFDGGGSQRVEERTPQGLQVIHAEATTTADALLERLASRYAAQHPMLVVSADGLVRETVLACGADWCSPAHLLALCEEAEQSLQTELKKLGRKF